MEIEYVSIKNRYGWVTITIAEFLEEFDPRQRILLIEDPEKAVCINQFAEPILPEEAVKILQQIEAS